MENLVLACLLLFCFYYLILIVVIIQGGFKSLFLKKTARRHRLSGLIYLAWIVVCTLDAHFLFFDGYYPLIAFSTIVLNIMGIIVTLSAAYGFSYHKRVQNVASGVLDEDSTVTFNEMIEHSFYQMVNLVQIIFFHGVYCVTQLYYDQLYSYLMIMTNKNDISNTIILQCIGLVFVTSLWLIRNKFPVNHFSDNYTKGQSTREALLYRLKKYQYVFYKHFLLHGLNITLVLRYEILSDMAVNQQFRLYWIGLNLAYVSEFFLQTLVKRKKLKQWKMIMIQQCLLMPLTTILTLPIIYKYVNLNVAMLSLLFNFMHRGHDFTNTIFVFLIFRLLLSNTTFDYM